MNEEAMRAMGFSEYDIRMYLAEDEELGEHQDYFNAAGERVPSVTELINKFDEKPHLKRWARDLAFEGKDFEVESNEYTTIGKIVHQMVEFELLGKPQKSYSTIPEDLVKHARISFSAWDKWKINHKITSMIASERKLVSERFQFGGTIDSVVILDGLRSILDLKTSKQQNINTGSKIQIAAYGKLWEQHYPDQPIECYRLLRLDKKDGSFDFYSWYTLEAEWEYFQKLLEMNRAYTEIENNFYPGTVERG